MNALTFILICLAVFLPLLPILFPRYRWSLIQPHKKLNDARKLETIQEIFQELDGGKLTAKQAQQMITEVEREKNN